MGRLHLAYLKRLARKIDEKTKVHIAGQKDVNGVKEIINIPYIDDGMESHLLDIYYPENTTDKLNVIINIHGGGFICGSKEVNRIFNKYMAKRGFVVVSVNYSLIDGKVRFKDIISDLFTAIHWVYNNISDYYGNKDHIYLYGDSAGATLTLMVASIANSQELLDTYAVEAFPFKQFKALAVISPSIGSMNPMGYLVAPSYREFLRDDYGKENYDLYFPDVFVPENYPPVYILTAKGDFLRKDAHKIEKLLSENNIPCELTDREEKLGHTFCFQNPYRQESIEAADAIERFFKKNF
ncbi:alpha/beta hydrolase [Amphibacillus sp. MSJ-3]|uniref:alpha/beta hydrolase n=1 Tax=Amphibacillus sp. MSJ-3 TaxID=2841505 RepID=UPI001C0F202A|nr:alpha/beta hydrolase [Amphibacillus sp. MSJ-3]MBU5593837.1 alpha/beta hydrolase [Amphibacillus sp. MSJ-3]